MNRSIYQQSNGYFVVSLDFELFWGVHDVFDKKTNAEAIRNARTVVPKLLQVFTEYQIQATWAAVGMLNIKNREELYKKIPVKTPAYSNLKLSSYQHINEMRKSYKDSDLYFAPELIRIIHETPGQEIGSHTFSHFYCLEEGQSAEDFKLDTQLFKDVISSVTDQIDSIVFPRNQVNPTYLAICEQLGMSAYRGNEPGWIYHMKGNDRKHFIKRGLRLLDTYINIFGPQSYRVTEREGILNIRGSRQLKPAAAKWNWLEKKRLNRILSSMTYAAKHQEIYHLWWHPHNFGINIGSNLHFLEKILHHYVHLNEHYNFESISMKRLSEKLI